MKKRLVVSMLAVGLAWGVAGCVSDVEESPPEEPTLNLDEPKQEQESDNGESDVVDNGEFAGEPELTLGRESVGFSSIPVEGFSWQVVEIENTGTAPLEFDEVAVQSGQEHFSIGFLSDPDEASELPGDDATQPPSELAADDDPVVMRVVYDPIEAGTHSGAVAFETNASGSPQIVGLNGRAIDAECPVAEAVGSIEDGLAADELTVQPGNVIQLDGTPSHDPDGTALSYQWALVDHPPQSGAAIDDSEAAETELFVDLVGQYSAELTVVDEEGIESCDTARVDIFARSDSEIRVELSWEVAESDDGTGTDLDLHYLHSTGDWNELPWDVHYNNPAPDWDDGSEVALEVDSLTGDHPETLRHDNPDPQYFYSVGVYYFGDPHGYGETAARVKVYLNESMVFDGQQQLVEAGEADGDVDFEQTGDFWYVGDVESDGAALTLEVVDELSDDAGFPGE